MALFLHICEVCALEEVLTPEEAYNAGWDYPPGLYAFGVVSPRTCGNCGIDKTLWWALAIENKRPEDLTAEQLVVLERIGREPASVAVIP